MGNSVICANQSINLWYLNNVYVKNKIYNFGTAHCVFMKSCENDYDMQFFCIWELHLHPSSSQNQDRASSPTWSPTCFKTYRCLWNTNKDINKDAKAFRRMRIRFLRLRQVFINIEIIKYFAKISLNTAYLCL